MITTFNRKGQLNKLTVSVPKTNPDSPRFYGGEKHKIEYYLNTCVFMIYATMREVDELVNICSSAFSKKELTYPDVKTFINNCSIAKSFLKRTIDDFMSRCSNQDGEKRVASLLSFAYDCSYTPNNAIKNLVSSFYSNDFKRKQKPIVIANLVCSYGLCVMASNICEMISKLYKSKVYFIDDFIHCNDVANACLSLYSALDFITKGLSTGFYKSNEFIVVQKHQSSLFTDRTFYPRCCKALGYTA